VTFADEQAWRSVSRKCGACLALAAMPEHYRAEVIDAMERPGLSTRAIRDQVIADGFDAKALVATWEKHRAGTCHPSVRRYLLGERDGLRR
jgi:hypothetical protein